MEVVVNWFLSNPLLSNPRAKPWIEILLKHRADLEHAAGGKLGVMLGCGHWGCVFDMPDTPWVLKLTVDPTEAHIWSKILELMKEEAYGQDGFPRFKKLFRLEPGIPYGKGGRTKIAYGIVREKVAPVFHEGPYKDVELTGFTKKHLGLDHLTTKVPVKGKPGAWREVPSPILYTSLLNKAITGLDQRTQIRVDEFVENIEVLKSYRLLAHQWHGSVMRRRGGEIEERQSQRIEQKLNRMGGPVGGPLGESLSMLLSNNVVLNDVHLFNLGWRFLPNVEGQEGYTCLVIFDPGHTPTDKRQLPAEKWQQFAAMC